MIRDKVGHFDFPMTRAAIQNEFLEEMDRLRTRASKLENQARRDMLLRLIDGHCRSFGQTPFKYVDEIGATKSSTTAGLLTAVERTSTTKIVRNRWSILSARCLNTVGTKAKSDPVVFQMLSRRITSRCCPCRNSSRTAFLALVHSPNPALQLFLLRQA